MAAYDVYAVTEQIAKNLQSEGKNELSDTIMLDMAAGCTGSEIQMALRWHLREFLEKGQVSLATTQDLIKEVLIVLDRNLG
jgi:hypothetical protein